MSKILFIGDPHLKVSNLVNVKKFLHWLNTEISRIQPDYIINLGDTFDTHAVIRSEIQGEFWSHLQACTAVAPYFYVLGNHDFFSPKDSTYHAVQAFKHVPNFIAIETVTHNKQLNATLVPYLPRHEDFPKDTLELCVAHQTFIGCDFGGYRPDDGVDAEQITAEMIISGHIHKKQSFGKVIYPGSPYSQSLKDVDEVKGLLLFDTDTFAQTFIPCPLPTYKKINVPVAGLKPTLHSISSSLTENDIHVIVFEGSKVDINAITGSSEFKQMKQQYQILTRENITHTNKTSRVKMVSQNTTSIIGEYIDKIYTGSLDKDSLKTRCYTLFKDQV